MHNQPPPTILVRKCDPHGLEKTRYPGSLTALNGAHAVVETVWPDGMPVRTAYGLSLDPGDGLIEHFYSDRWYNVFAMYGPRVDGHIVPASLKGWYANVTRPALFEPAHDPRTITWPDLALDVWMGPDGRALLLDEDEFEAMRGSLDPLDVASALGAVAPATEACLRLWRAHMNERIAALLLARGWTIGTAESCTGGLIGDTLTDRAGSSGYFMGGIISYDNRVKREALGVPDSVLITHGAVSEPCARAMAQGARAALGVDVAVSATGIAGPDGGSPDKPVGLVYLGGSTPDGDAVERHVWSHDRAGNKRASADAALRLVLKMLGG